MSHNVRDYRLNLEGAACLNTFATRAGFAPLKTYRLASKLNIHELAGPEYRKNDSDELNRSNPECVTYQAPFSSCKSPRATEKPNLSVRSQVPGGVAVLILPPQFRWEASV